MDSPPSPNGRAYLPIDNDLKNHVYTAKRSPSAFLPMSTIDQCKVSDPEGMDSLSPATEKLRKGHFYGNDGGDGDRVVTDTNN